MFLDYSYEVLSLFVISHGDNLLSLDQGREFLVVLGRKDSKVCSDMSLIFMLHR